MHEQTARFIFILVIVFLQWYTTTSIRSIYIYIHTTPLIYIDFIERFWWIWYWKLKPWLSLIHINSPMKLQPATLWHFESLLSPIIYYLIVNQFIYSLKNKTISSGKLFDQRAWLNHNKENKSIKFSCYLFLFMCKILVNDLLYFSSLRLFVLIIYHIYSIVHINTRYYTTYVFYLAILLLLNKIRQVIVQVFLLHTTIIDIFFISFGVGG